jgi:hypothetical protein
MEVNPFPDLSILANTAELKKASNEDVAMASCDSYSTSVTPTGSSNMQVHDTFFHAQKALLNKILLSDE